MSWQALLKTETDIPTKTEELVLLLMDSNRANQLINSVKSAETVNQLGAKRVNELYRTFEQNPFVNAVTMSKGKEKVEQIRERLNQLYEVIQPKLGRTREKQQEKIISAYKNPSEYKEFIESLKENPLTKEQLRRLSAQARESYRALVDEDKETYTLNLKFKEENPLTGEKIGISEQEFQNALKSLSELDKISLSGTNLVFNATNVNEVNQILNSDKAIRAKYDKFLRPFLEKTSKNAELAMPKSKLSQQMTQDVLADKIYQPKTDLNEVDFTKYLEILNKSNVSVKQYLPLVTGGGTGIAEEAYSFTTSRVSLSPYGDLVLMSSIGTNWKEDYFGNVKTSGIFSQENAEQAVITDIFEEIKRMPQNELRYAKLDNLLPLNAFANIDLERTPKKQAASKKQQSKNQRIRDEIIRIINSSPELFTKKRQLATQKRSETIKQMMKDNTLLLITEAKEAQRKMGGEITYYDASNNKLEDTTDPRIFFARLKVGNEFVNRENIEADTKDRTEEEIAQVNERLQRIKETIEYPTDERELFDICYGLMEQQKMNNILSAITSKRRNNLVNTSVENGLIFLLSMEDDTNDDAEPNLFDALEKLESYDDLTYREKKQLEKDFEEIDSDMSDRITTYKNEMLKALSKKLTDVGKNYSNYQKPQEVEIVIKNLVDAELLTEE